MGNGVRTRFIPADKVKKRYVMEFKQRGKEPHKEMPYLLLVSYARIIHLYHENPYPTYEAAMEKAKTIEEGLMERWQDPNQHLGQLPRVFVVAAEGVFFLTQDGVRGHERVAYEDILHGNQISGHHNELNPDN